MNLPQTPMPDFTMQVMEKVPTVAVGVALLMGAVAFVRNRGNKGDAVSMLTEPDDEARSETVDVSGPRTEDRGRCLAQPNEAKDEAEKKFLRPKVVDGDRTRTEDEHHV
jgi:hypothetical protein